jgi:hypothetical protein
MIDADATLAAVAVIHGVVGAIDADSPIAERVMARDGLDGLFDTLTRVEVEAVCLQLAGFVWAVSDTVGFPLCGLLCGLRAEAVEQTAR